VSPGSDTATVLVVDDEEEVADVYALRLRNEFDTRVAYSGDDALASLDDDIDVVLLDRRMPDQSGDEVLERIREGEYDYRVIMLTAVDPGLDIAEMPFDDYLCKPVEKEDLVTAIEQQLRIKRHDDALAEYLEVTSKLDLLEAELSSQQLSDNEEVGALRDRAADLRAEVEGSVDDLDEIEDSFQEIGRYPG
jgi:DNA-binding response OmpR family regulator